MTAEQTAEQLQSKELVGFNFTMAREDLRCAVMTGTHTPEQTTELLDSFTSRIEDTFFGSDPIYPVKRLEDAVCVVHSQLGCIAGSGIFREQDVNKHMTKYEETASLSDVMKNTIADFIGPLLLKSDESY